MLKPTLLRCSRTTALTIITANIFLLLLIGCASLFRSAGLTDQQATQQTAQLKAALADATTAAADRIQTGLAQGQDLKTTAIDASRIFLWKIVAAAGASAGIILNGLLAKWLRTETKINKILITGIEKNGTQSTKETIQARAKEAGVEPQLNARVRTLT